MKPNIGRLGQPAPRSSRQPSLAQARHGRLFKLAALVLSLALAVLLAELGLRLFFWRDLFNVQDERNLMYRYDKTLGWFPVPNSHERLLGSRVITVSHNRIGFRSAEPVQDQRPSIVFLGDSFVWGYDVEATERFTDKLQVRHPEWNVHNLGVSGYGTDQEYLLLQQHFGRYKPRVVFLVFCVETDHEDNSSNMRYAGYYKPFCTLSGTQLQLRGIPVPRGERVWLNEHEILARSCVVRSLVRVCFKMIGTKVVHNPDPTGPLIRDMQKFVATKGALLLIGLTRSNPRLEEFLQFFKIPYVDLSTTLRFPKFGNHWTPEGHSTVCDKIENFLLEGNYLKDESDVPRK